MAEPGLGRLGRVRHFITTEIWTQKLHPGSWVGRGTRLLQLGVVIVEGFVRDQLLLRAAALTYITVLAIVPLLAIVLSVLKGLGVSEDLGSFVVDQIPAADSKTRASIIGVVKSVDIGGLGTLGGVVFIVMTVMSLRHLESTLNGIWGVPQTRSWSRRFSDYLAVMIVAPLLIAIAISLGTTLQAASVVTWLASAPVLSEFYHLGLREVPMLLAGISFTFLYWFFPNTRVWFSSALLGGAVAAVLFSLTQYGYVAFSIGVAKSNAVYGGFAAIPLLLVWIYVSWSIVLMGAEVLFAYQNLGHYRREVGDKEVGLAEREAVGIRLALYVGVAFRDSNPPFTAEILADRIEISVRTVISLLEQFREAGLVNEVTAAKGGKAFSLGRPAELITLADIIRTIRGLRRPMSGDPDAIAALSESVVVELEGARALVTTGRTLEDVLQGLAIVDEIPERA